MIFTRCCHTGAMAIDPKLLGTDEHVILHLRTHVKKLFWNAVVLIVASAALGVFLAMQPEGWKPWGTWVALGLFLVIVLVWFVWPLLTWLTTTYTITNRRIITRTGIISRSGHDLPLRRVNNVAYERDLLDRILGCGTLVLETAAEQPLVLPDLPSIERVHVQITEVLFGDLHTENPVHDD